MKLWVKLLPLFLFVYLTLPIFVLARSGCCSWHGGVCGCRCCDGSPLSSTCAPYYPSCNSAPVVQEVYPTSTNTPKPVVPTSVPTQTPIKVPTATPSPIPTKIPTSTPAPQAPTSTPISPTKTIIPTTTITASPTLPPTSSPQVMGTSDTNQETKTDNNNGSTIGGLLLAGAGYVGYKLFKRKKENT